MNLKLIFNKYKIVLLLGFIILFSAFSRFYRLDEIYVFNFDEEYQATYAWTLVKDPHPIWIGVSASFLDFYLGPYFTYFTAILLAISHGDPLIGAYFAAFVGVATTTLIFFIGWKIFNLTTGVISSLLYATLPLFVFFDQKYWNTMFTPLITLLLFLTMILVKKSPWWWVLFAAAFGSVLQTHLEPAPLLLIGVFYFVKDKYWKNIKLLAMCLLVFALFYWPLAVFDYYHNFSNWTLFSRFKTNLDASKIAFDPSAKFRTLFDSAGRFWYLKAGNPNADEINFGCTSLSVKKELKFIDQYAKRTYAHPVLSLLTFILLLIFLWKSFKEKRYQYKMLSIFLGVSLFFFMIFPGGSSEYYTLYFLVLFTFVPGILISKAKNFSLPLTILIILASIVGVNTIVNASGEFSLAPKKFIIKKVMEVVKDKPFAIEGRGVCHDYEGWR
ncbi:MAG: glycosyltransferase family 39 protein, partial [Candidatus Daviesbacteria bacterium]|nr:glycosyltransferase family 39 protein [Candidatus Daviesbacteria bacterium]